MSDVPRLEFPCAYPVKVLGDNTADFADAVLAVFSSIFVDESLQSSQRSSSAGRFVAVTVTVNATGPEQLAQLHEALKLIDGLRLVL